MAALRNLGQYWGSFLAMALVGLIASARHSAILLLFVWLVLGIYGIASIVKLIRTPQLRVPFFVKGLMWIAMSVLVASWHLYLHYSTRSKAQEVVAKIERFYETTGAYPGALSDIGMSKDELEEQLGLSYYGNAKGKVSFGYASTFIPFEVEQYDFSRREWSHVYD